MAWLDGQPDRSVVFLCFGSVGWGAHSKEQLREIAVGLENSGHMFMWVVRAPYGGVPDLGALLPDGFLEGTAGRGIIVKLWAPQVDVLRHRAIGTFVTHCGWTSVLEGVMAGVLMICWPLYAEQRMNAVVLEGSVGMALPVRPRARDSDGDGGVVLRGEIADALRELMEGPEKGRAVRREAGDMQQAAAHAWAPEGSSRRALEEAAVAWKAWRGWRGEAVTNMSASGNPR